MFICIPFPLVIDMEDELIHIRLSLLPSFYSTETVNREPRKVGWGGKLAKNMALCLKKIEKSLFDLVW